MPIDPILGSTLIGTGADIIQNIGSTLFGNAREKKNWKMQAEYNSPKAQMSRLKDAGLNPNLVYGNGTVANTMNATPKTHDYQPTSVTNSIMAYQQMKQMKLQNDSIAQQIKTSQAQENYYNESAGDKRSLANSRDNYGNENLMSKTAVNVTTKTLNELQSELKRKELQYYDSDKARQVDFENVRNAIQRINKSFLPTEKKEALREIATRIAKMYTDMSKTNIERQMVEIALKMRERGVETSDSMLLRMISPLLPRKEQSSFFEAVKESIKPTNRKRKPRVGNWSGAGGSW